MKQYGNSICHKAIIRGATLKWLKDMLRENASLAAKELGSRSAMDTITFTFNFPAKDPETGRKFFYSSWKFNIE